MLCPIMMRKHPENALCRKADFARKSTRLRQSRHAASCGPVPWVRLSVIILVFGALAGAAAAPGLFAPRYTIIHVATLGGFGSAALGINDIGQVVGGADRSDGLRGAILWADGAMIDLVTDAQATQGEANDVNNKRQDSGLAGLAHIPEPSTFALVALSAFTFFGCTVLRRSKAAAVNQRRGQQGCQEYDPDNFLDAIFWTTFLNPVVVWASNVFPWDSNHLQDKGYVI